MVCLNTFATMRHIRVTQRFVSRAWCYICMTLSITHICVLCVICVQVNMCDIFI